MPVFQINDDEREALRGLPMLSREIYVFGLRPFADSREPLRRYLTAIREEVFVDPMPGLRNAGSPTNEAVRAGLLLLKRRGLVEILDAPTAKCVVLRLPLANQRVEP